MAALTSAGAYTITTFAAEILSPTKNISSLINDVFGVGLIFLIGTITVTFTIGLPIFVLGWHFELLNWWSCTIVGFLLGYIVGIANPDRLIIGLAGTVGGFACWLTWRFLSKFSLHRQKIHHV